MAFNNRGILLGQIKRYEEAIANYDQAIALDPDSLYTYGDRLFAQLSIGQWHDLEAHVAALFHKLECGIAVSQPFPLLAVPTTLDTLSKCVTLFVADKCPPVNPPLWQGERYAHERIRLGYFSADLHNHATAHLMAELFERHDRSRFEVFAFSFGPIQHDAMRERLVKAFDHFFEVAALSHRAIAAMARQWEIDIAVDLKGYTQDCRPGILALRPAPLQVNYLGFPGTLGAPYIDYLIADAVVVPREHFAFYSEKVVHLPHCYQVNDSQRRIADAVPSRGELGLPETGFVFCCFNNNFKITPDVFSVWMRLLAQVPGSVLWLLEGNTAIRQNLSREAQQRGIDPGRLVFAPRMALPEHLARHRQADLFLDTFYYNAHTTTSDALWAGLPVLTCLGNTFAGRVAASCLAAVGLPALTTHSHDEYEALALKLARDPNALAAIKNTLAQHRASHPLFNTQLFTQHIEQAYSTMWQLHLQNLPPQHFIVGP
jgi:predicted O-linked N-acetylglucosamine transferase (SPINDLY family)